MKYLNYIFISLIIALKMSQYDNSGTSSPEVSQIYYIICTFSVKICFFKLMKVNINLIYVQYGSMVYK